MRLPPQTGWSHKAAVYYMLLGTNNMPALAAVKSCTDQKQKGDGSLCQIPLPLEKIEDS